MITPFDAFEILLYVFGNTIENPAFAPFSIIISKLFKIYLNFSCFFFQSCLKIENDVNFVMVYKKNME